MSSSRGGKNKGGRPLKFKSPNELQQKIDEYFESCFEDLIVRDRYGKPIVDPTTKLPVTERLQVRAWTITGLAVHLGVSRQTLLEYEGEVEGRVKKDPRFADAIKRAKNKIEAFTEEKLFEPKIATGVIFNLKNNYKWHDKQEVELTTQKLIELDADD